MKKFALQVLNTRVKFEISAIHVYFDLNFVKYKAGNPGTLNIIKFVD